MAFPSATISFPSHSLYTFHEHLKHSKRIVALLGADLSALTDLELIYEGSDDELRPNNGPSTEASEHASDWARNFYHRLRQQALIAQPNEAHEALARLAEKKGRDGFFALNMNVDGLCARAGLPAEQMIVLRGNLFDLHCGSEGCGYSERCNMVKHPGETAPVVPGSDLAISEFGDLPTCPRCEVAILQPDTVSFVEDLPKELLTIADKYIEEVDHIDLMLVIGPTASIWPAARYVEAAVAKGARVALVTTDRRDLTPDVDGLYLTDSDWCFVGNASKLVPELLQPIVDEFADVGEWCDC